MLPPRPSAPILSHVVQWMKQPYDFFDRCQRERGDMFRLWLPGLGNINVVGYPEGVREVFTLTAEAGHAGEANRALKPFLGEHSLLMLDGAQHARHRKLMTPAFHGERMLSYGGYMLETADDVADAMPLGRVFSFHQAMQELTVRIIIRTVFGVAEGPRFHALMRSVAETLDAAAWPPLLFPQMQVDLGPWSPWGKFQRSSTRVVALLQEEIDERRARGGSGGRDVLSSLMETRDEAGNPLSDQELIEELVTLLVAGHETTATSLSWALRWLLPEPALCDRLRDEVAGCVVDGALSPERLARSEFLDGVVKESLRLIPVIPVVARVMQQPLRLREFEIPVGGMVAPSIHLIHHRPELYPEPRRFNPDRYKTFRPSSWEWIPFGGGIRRCLGASFAVYEMKMALAVIFRRLHLRLAPGYQPRPERRAITITPSAGLPVVLLSRAPSLAVPRAA